MNSDRVMQDAGGGAGSSAVHPKCYVAAAPLLEVMQDQLRYLVGHGNGKCFAACAECARLEKVKQWLLTPFA